MQKRNTPCKLVNNTVQTHIAEASAKDSREYSKNIFLMMKLLITAFCISKNLAIVHTITTNDQLIVNYQVCVEAMAVHYKKYLLHQNVI